MNSLGKYIVLFCLMAVVNVVYGTHYRAGEILYEVIGNFKIRATVVTYAKWSSPSNLADRDTINVLWGDGSNSMLVRSNGPDIDPPNGFPDGVFVADDIKKNVYVGEHQYTGTPPEGFFIISFEDQNRMAGINNISNGNSVEVPFFVEDTVKFPTSINNIGFNSSPVLLHPPIDYANVNDTFFHNPLAIDANGDSLDFEFKIPLRGHGINVPLYVYPDQYCKNLGNPFCTLTMDRHTGQITWATPCVAGFFNIAILIHEYRNGVNIGTLIRDMQIIVVDIRNNPPQIVGLPDTCIRAGDTLLTQITATDRQVGQRITLTADGGPFQVNISPATFTSTVANPATGNFSWLTTCDHIRAQPYLVLFAAEDDYKVDANTEAHLVDLETWQIRVIPPEVEDLTAIVNRNSVTLNWKNPYKCASSPNFRGFSVWRKIGCDPYTPEYCETGLAGRGYTKLTGANISAYTYTDNTAIVGQAYSYRVVAEFYKLPPSGAESLKYDVQQSIASNEVCVFVPINVPVMINVSVNTTDAVNGQIFVRWTKPLAGGVNLDTLQFPPPYRFDLYRSQGFNFTSPATLIHSSANANSFTELTDTTFTDTGLNTLDFPWNYKVLFYSNNDTVGATEAASSIYLNVLPSDKSLNLTWQENVPWLNDSFAIFKLDKATSVFDSIAISYTHTYADTGLLNDSVYCYYVKGYGHYTVSTFPSPLINLSQEDCASPSDSTPPCPPVLTVRNDCGKFDDQSWDSTMAFINFLLWSNPYDSCTFDIRSYNIYFASDSDAALSLIDSVLSKADTTFNHVQPDNLAGCYAVTAVDRAGNESQFSNIFCIDNCPFYILPNAFTPNGIGRNELFHPLYRHRFVTKIEMKIFNRWGELVFETTDPEINWDGKDQKTGKNLSEGVYLYSGYYYEQRLNGIVRRPLSGQKKGGGFIHLIRGN